jgi:ACS family pantothenate transporter-like MFS transporter
MPDKKDTWYLTEEEREHAYKRLGEARKHTWDRTVFRRVLLSWQFWLLPFIFMCKWHSHPLTARANTA